MPYRLSLNTIYAPLTNCAEYLLRNDVVDGERVAVIIDAVATHLEEALWQVTLFIPKWIKLENFSKSAHIKQSGVDRDATFIQEAHLGRIVFESNDLNNISIHFNDFESAITISEPDTIFNGKNVAVVISNQNSPEHALSWIAHNRKYHELEGMIMLDRLAPDENADNLFDRCASALEGQNFTFGYLALTVPLGKAQPSDKTLWMCPSAPGKDQMSEPPIDPWHAEFDGNLIIEILRLRYLSAVNALMFTQISDIIPPSEKSIFARVREDESGYLPLIGQMAYPWRVREGDEVTYGDHVCVQISDEARTRSWIISQHSDRLELTWQLYRIGSMSGARNRAVPFWRMMGLRHIDPNDNNPNLAPKTALIRNEELLSLASDVFDHKPVQPPEMATVNVRSAKDSGRRLIVTTMKNEGPFLLEWIAYHRAIGFDDFIVFTNDCDDGTDAFFDLLQDKGIVEHRQNPYRKTGLKPQHAALFDAPKSKLFGAADWKICMDVDEYVNIKIGNGHLNDLFDAIGNANMISLTWRLIGNSGVVDFVDTPIISQFNQAAHYVTRFPHQAWGVKTLYRDMGFFKKMGVHRPKGLRPEKMESINWVNGSGKPLPGQFYRNGWRTGSTTVGYDLVELNHYAVRSMESFLVKRDRGRVNHVDRDQGLHYWFRMNHNVVEENSIKSRIPMMETELEKLMADEDIAKMHQSCVDAHRRKIDDLLKGDSYQNFFAEIKSDRMHELSKYTNKYGPNVFELGPHTIDNESFLKLKNGEIPYFNVNQNGKPFS